MQVIIDEIVTEVVIEGAPAETNAPSLDMEALRELILEVLRDELERHERHEDGTSWR